MQHLEPCPFCAHTGVTIIKTEPGYSGGVHISIHSSNKNVRYEFEPETTDRYRCFSMCEKCGARGPLVDPHAKDSEESAITLWNQRLYEKIIPNDYEDYYYRFDNPNSER